MTYDSFCVFDDSELKAYGSNLRNFLNCLTVTLVTPWNRIHANYMHEYRIYVLTSEEGRIKFFMNFVSSYHVIQREVLMPFPSKHLA